MVRIDCVVHAMHSFIVAFYTLRSTQPHSNMWILAGSWQHIVWPVVLALLVCTKSLTSSGYTDQSPSDAGDRPVSTLRILLIAPFPDSVLDPGYDGGHTLVPSGLLAVEEINNHSSMLPGYRLEAVVGDGGCNINIKAVSRILENVIHRSPNDRVIGIAGPVCSEATQALSDLMNRHRIKLPLVTIANSPVLAEPDRYPFTYGIVSTSEEYAEMVVSLYRKLEMEGKWRNISLFYDGNRLYHRDIYRSILLKLRNDEKSRIYASPISPKYLPLEDIVEGGTRIVFVFSSKTPACMLICRAYHLGMTSPSYQFFFTDRTLSNTFESCANGTENLVFSYNHDDYSCSNEQILETVRNSILLSFDLQALSLESNSTVAVSGNNFEQYKRKYEERLTSYGNSIGEKGLRPTQWAAPLYDAVWAVALAANQTLPNLNFDSQLDIWDPNELTETFDSLSFRGVSSVVDFNARTGFSNSTISISRVEYNKETQETVAVLKGYYDAGKLFDADDRKSNDTVLSLYIDSDFNTSTESLPLIAAITGYLLTIHVFAATVTFHILYYYYRRRPSIKAASPQLSHFIFLGCYVILGSIVLDTTDVSFSPSDTSRHLFLCYTVVWMKNIGVTLVFSTLFVKYYRLYLVFLKTYDHRSNLSNKKLSLIVVALVGVDIAILGLWTIFKPLTINTTVEFDHERETPINREKKICQETDSGRWFLISLSLYLSTIILAVVTLSILNRRIKQRDFNTTATTNILVYLYILLLAILIPFVYIESNYRNINIKYSLVNTVYLTFTILCLVFLFTPPLLQRNKKTRAYSLTHHLQKISNLVALHAFEGSISWRRPSEVT